MSGENLIWKRNNLHGEEKSTNQSASLDFFLISELLFTSVVESEILVILEI